MGSGPDSGGRVKARSRDGSGNDIVDHGAVLRTDTNGDFANALIAQLPALRRYAAALAGSVALGDDLVQDCIERALRQADRLRDRDRLSSWLRAIVRNLYMDELRRKRKRGIEQEVTGFDNDPALSIAISDHTPSHEFTAAMNALSAEHREILLLVGLEGMNYRELAETLGIPQGTVMSRLARARARLREALEKGTNRACAASLEAKGKLSP